MNIIFNHTLRSIKNNRAQIALIITTIAIVTVMIFVALSITGLFYNINVSAQSRLGENMDIALRGELFPKAKVEDYVNQNKDTIETADYYLQLAGLVRTESQTRIIMLEATDFESVYKKYPQKLKTAEAAQNNFEYPAVWIGQDFATELNLNAGDTIEIYYQSNNKYEKFSISRIMQNQGFFADINVNNILIDYTNVNSRGMINTANLRLRDKENFQQVTQDLKAFMRNDAIEIESAIDYQRVEEIVSNNSRLLNIALAFIMTIMGLILFTSYLVIAKSRLNEMIIFKAAGATPFQTTLIMLSEVLFYGIVGATVGLLLGRISMGFMTKALLPNFPDAVTYDLWKYIVAFFVGIIVSVASALLPILKISRKSIREMTSGIVKDIKFVKPIFIILITVLLGICLTLLLMFDALVVPMTILLIVLFAFWIYFAVPYVIKWLSALFARFKGQSSLASISIKRNSSTNTLTVLVGSVITFSFIVVSVISLIVTAITPYNTRFNSDYVINSSERMDYQTLTDELSVINGIDEIVYFRNAEFELERKNKNPLGYHVVGISSGEALKYATQELNDNDIQTFNNTSHPIIINNDMAVRWGIGKGDKITLSRVNSTASVTYDETLDYEFVVTGIDYTTTEYDRIVYIKLEDMVYNGNMVDFHEEKIFIIADSGADTQNVYLSIRDKLSTSPQLFVLKFEDWVTATAKGLSGVSLLLRIIQFLVSFVAFVGVINLTIVTFTDRKNEFKVYKTSGMSVKKFNLLSIFEGLIIGLAGGIIGIILSFFFNSLMPSFAGLINKYMDFNAFPLDIPVISIIALFVYVAIYTLISLSNKKSYLELNYYYDRNI